MVEPSPAPELSPQQRRLFDLLQRERRKAVAAAAPGGSTSIPRRAPSDPLVLSFGQKRLWFIEQLQPGTAAYHVPGAVRIQGALDVAVLARALREMARHHETLRTAFATVDGQPVPAVSAEPRLRLTVADLRHVPAVEREAEADRVVDAHVLTPFDLGRPSLARASLCRVGAEEYIFLLILHHIISDIWSVGVFFRAMMALYEAFSAGRPSPLPELPIQYTDYALWQQRLLTGQSLDTLLSYWKGQVEGAPWVLELPIDHPRPAIQSFSGGRAYMQLGLALTERLKAVSKQQEASLYMILLATLDLLLYRYTGQQTILVGVPMANRSRVELEGLIGLLFNALVLRSELADGMTFRELLAQVRERTLRAFNHQDLPFERLIEELRVERDMSRNPLFQVLFAFQNVPPSAMQVPGLALSRYEVRETTSREDLELDLRETPEGLAGWFGYDRALFDPSTIARATRHFRALLEGIAAQPERPLGELPLLTASEVHVLLREWNDTAATAGGGLLELFEAQSAAVPAAPAVTCEGRTLSYGELAARAGHLAGRLAGPQVGVRPGDVVALLARRGVDLLTAILAIWRAGGVYLPLDPEHPPQRQAQVLGLSRSPVVLADAELLPAAAAAAAELTAAPAPRVLSLPELLLGDAADHPPLAAAPAPGDLAYVIFTSGSTGVPKGAMLEHRGMANHLLAKVQTLGLTARDAVAQTASQCFDISIWQLLAALTVGGSIHIYPDEVAHDPARLLERIAADAVTVLETVPSLLRLMLDELERSGGPPRPRALRWMIPTGEALPPELCRRWHAVCSEVALLNAYGPTECSDDVTHCPLPAPSPADAARVPIGRAVRNLRLYVVDHALRLVPTGVVGELCVGGVGVGRGYLGAAAQTAEAFVPDPFAPDRGARLYRTGDRVRRLADGQLDFLGRLDHQVKVRGFRIELGEIESVLARHPRLAQAVVAHEAGVAGSVLVAYVVPRGGGAPPESELRDLLKASLPEYMVPAGFVTLEAMPLTANGKVDRRALLARGGAALEAHRAYVAPHTPVEESLAGIWAEVLRLPRVGVHDNFFDIGGQSLLATQVVSRIREAFEVELPVRAVFQRPDVAGLAEAVEEAMLRGRGLPDALPMARIPRDGHLEPSFGQERFWFIDQLRPGLTAYNIFGAVRMRGALDVPTLQACFDELVRRHEVLRTTFAAVDGRPVQVIGPAAGLPIPLVDLRGLPAARRAALAADLGNEEAQRPFDLARGPLIRGVLLRVADDDHLLAVTAHHIVYDVWSRELLVRELGVLYEAFWHRQPSPLPALPIQYADFAHWQRRWLQGAVLDAQLAYWRQQLAGVTSGTELPGDRPRPPVQSFRGRRALAELDAETTAALKGMSRKQGATLFMTLLAGFEAFLYRYTGEEDLVVGSPIANRNRAETEALIGFFVNTQVLRVGVGGRPTFRELIGRVRETALAAYAHQDLAFEQLVGDLRASRDPARQPLFQILFNFLTNYRPIAMELPGLLLTPEPNHSGAVQFDLILSMYEADGQLHLSADYGTDLYDHSTMERMLRHYTHVLGEAAAAPERVFSELPLWGPEEERQLVVEWNATTFEVPRDRTAHELFAEQAARRPAAVAAVCDGRQVGYAELHRTSNALARRLVAEGVGPDAVVVLLAERGIEFLAAMLGIWKAGGAYLPLDSRHPAERLRQVILQSGARLLLLSRTLADVLGAALLARLEEADLQVRTLEDLLEGEAEDLPPRAYPESLAYVIYTSGSTGVPKGAMVTHRGMLNHLFVKIRDLGLGPDDAVAQNASHTFDISVWQFVAALLAGGRVHIFRDEVAHDPPRLLVEVSRHGVTVLETVPSLLQLMLNEPATDGAAPPPLPRLRWLLVTGEALPPELCRRWFASYRGVPLVNAYGPTECSDDVTHHLVREAPPAGRVHTPIGRPVGNLRLYALSADLLPVPPGVPGELWVGGAGVGRGYLRDPARTAELFLPDPFSGEAGARLYRTQDLVRRLPDGELEFLGRVDHQVKIRGSRIELGEIESVLARHPRVREVAVVVREQGGDKRLVACVVAPDAGRDPAPLRAFLRDSLPDYMLPSAFLFLDAMPLNANGKVDRRALAALEVEEVSLETPFVAPRSELETQLARLWSELLGVDRVGVHDNFFDLGGHSLLTTQLVSRLRGAFQLDVPLPTFFEDPTVAGLAHALELARWAEQVASEAAAVPAMEAGAPMELEEGEL